MTPPEATSTTVLIIPLILNTLSAPPHQTWPRSTVSAPPEILYPQFAEQPPHHDPSSWIPPVDICSAHFGMANATDSSVLLLLLVSLPSPSQGDQPAARRYGCSNSNSNSSKRAFSNHTAPWASLQLEPGNYGVLPQVRRDEPVCSNPFGLNISIDAGLFSLISEPSVLPMLHPMIDIQDSLISDQPASGAPALFGFVLCSSDGNDGSFIPVLGTTSMFRDGRRYQHHTIMDAQPRKLLGARAHTHSSSFHGDHRQGCVRKEKTKHLVTAAGIAFGFALLTLLCSVVGGLCLCARRLLKDERRIVQSGDLICPSGPRRYSHRELAAATRGFSNEGKIGRGGFGPVYRGFLRDRGCHVAVKVPGESSLQGQQQGRREFQSEVKVMTSLRHRNIVQLLGWCDAPRGGLMLVYEFVPNGSLDRHLYDSQRILSWSDRYRIALGVGSAIQYLHTECEQCVLHGDIKPANILLDASFSAKLGDFGLARLVDHGADSRTTQVVVGTPGYIDPEFVSSQRPSVESDIYSFGVVLLEIVCGRRPTTTTTRHSNGGTPVLLNWVRDMYRRDSVLGVVDGRLDGEFDDQQVERVLVAGLWCAHHDQGQRPSIADAMDFLRRRRQDAEPPVVLEQLGMLSPDSDAVCSLEGIASHDLSEEDSAFENSTTQTVYHSS